MTRKKFSEAYFFFVLNLYDLLDGYMFREKGSTWVRGAV